MWLKKEKKNPFLLEGRNHRADLNRSSLGFLNFMENMKSWVVVSVMFAVVFFEMMKFHPVDARPPLVDFFDKDIFANCPFK